MFAFVRPTAALLVGIYSTPLPSVGFTVVCYSPCQTKNLAPVSYHYLPNSLFCRNESSTSRKLNPFAIVASSIVYFKLKENSTLHPWTRG